MRRLADAREQVETWRSIETKTTELVELLELAAAEADKEVAAEVAVALRGHGAGAGAER